MVSVKALGGNCSGTGGQASKQASKLHETWSERNETAVAEVGKGGGQSPGTVLRGRPGAVREVGAIQLARFPRRRHSLLPCELRTDSPAFPVFSPVLSPAAARSAPKKEFLTCSVSAFTPPLLTPHLSTWKWMYSPFDYVTRLSRCMRQFAGLSWCWPREIPSPLCPGPLSPGW